MASKLPYMKLWVDDLDNDPNVEFMTMEEEGLYLRLLRVQWRNEYLPAEPEKLRILCRHHAKAFDRCWPTISFLFPQSAPGQLQNPRCAAEREAAIGAAETRSTRAKKGAAARWPDKKEEGAPDKPAKAKGAKTDWKALVEWWNELAARFSMASIRGLSKDRQSKWRARVAANPDFKIEVMAELELMDESNRTAQWFGLDFILSETKALRFLEGKYRQAFGGNGGGPAFTWKDKRVQVKKGTPGSRHERGAFGTVAQVEHKKRGRISVNVLFDDPPPELVRESGRSAWYPSENVEVAQ